MLVDRNKPVQLQHPQTNSLSLRPLWYVAAGSGSSISLFSQQGSVARSLMRYPLNRIATIFELVKKVLVFVLRQKIS